MALKTQLEQVNCHVCGSDNTTILFEGEDLWFKRPGRFPVCVCQVCGLIYLNPRPHRDAIGAYYPDSYQPYKIATEDIESPTQRWEQAYSIQKRVNVIQKHCPNPGTVLDVGCATGNMLAALRDVGWQPTGVEMNPTASAYARERHQLDVFTGELNEAAFENGRFDLVIFWDVLEHVFEPKETLQEAARIAKSEATLILTLPNPESIDAKLFGSSWGGWDTPRHLQIFPKAVVNRLLNETGWEMENLICMTGRHWLFNLSLQHWLEQRVDSKKVRQFILSITRSTIFRAITLPYFILVEKLKRGSVMVIFARRKVNPE
ncbi:MAG: class I SAM-dependent methyltransferase [Chloroflexota bacterium]